MPEKDIFYRLTIRYYHFTKAEKRVADYIIANRNDVRFMSISEFSKACDVADSTITRFCRKIQCEGYNAFKLELAASSSGRNVATGQDREDEKCDIRRRFEDVKNNHQDTIEESLSLADPIEITKAVELISQAGTILCVGQGASMIMAQEAAHLFSTVRNNVMAMLDSHIQAAVASNLRQTDAVICFSYSGSTRELVELIAINKRNNVKTILITRYPRSPGALQADIVLLCGSVQPPQEMGSVAAKIAQLFILDLLYSEYTLKYPEECERFKKNISKSLSTKHI